MSQYLCLTIRFLQPYFHGQREGGEPEWPPSPLRVFQSLVAAAAAQSPERQTLGASESALRWLEHRSLPMVVAPEGKKAASPYRMYVPNNAADLVAAAWTRGSVGASVAEHRTEKDVRPTNLNGDSVHYLYRFDHDNPPNLSVLQSAARSITHLGWGIDMVVGDVATLSEVESQELVGERWLPGIGTAGTSLRVPVEGTLAALVAKHQAFLRRFSTDGFRPVPPLTAFRVVNYRRDFEPASLPVAAFQLLDPDADTMRPFDTARRGCSVAGMLRHITGLAAVEAHWDQERIGRIIFGHAADIATNESPTSDTETHSASLTPQSSNDVVGTRRLAYIPLPSLEFRGKGLVVGSIRRVLITSLSGECSDEVRWTTRALSGRDLIGKHDCESQALLSAIPNTDRMVNRYTRPASTWSTVTPVILPGRDDRSQRKAERLLRKAIRQAGFSELLANHAEVEWRNVAFWPGADLASRYFVPDHLRSYPRFHVRIVWKKSPTEPVEIAGPICLGGGRHYGLGLFAAVNE